MTLFMTLVIQLSLGQDPMPPKPKAQKELPFQAPKEGWLKKIRRLSTSGKKEGEKAKVEGLNWLLDHMHPDGYWKDQKRPSIGVTALGLMTFMNCGHTPKKGRYKKAVQVGLRYLVKQQGIEIDGLFGGRRMSHFMYNHVLASKAVCMACGSSKDPILRDAAEQALEFLSKARNPYKVWRYHFPPTGRDEDNDMSVTGQVLLTLCLARDAKLEIDERSFDAAVHYLNDMTEPKSGRTGYIDRGGYSAREADDVDKWPHAHVETMTALALCCRHHLDEFGDKGKQDVINRGMKLLSARKPMWQRGHVDFLYWYYGSEAMSYGSDKLWKAWKRNLDDALLRGQVTEGREAGSWNPEDDPWGDVGGRAFTTALAVLALAQKP